VTFKFTQLLFLADRDIVYSVGLNIVCFLVSDFPVSLLMSNMFVVALVPFKSHCYFFKIYFAADTATTKPEADLLELISRNRDIM